MIEGRALERLDTPVNTNLRALVGHAHCVLGNTSIARAQKLFQQHRFNYMAVTDDQKVIGICSRDRVGGMLGSQFGFSIYGKKPIRDFMVPQPEIITDGTPIQEVLDKVFGRSPERFFEDAILVEANRRLIGLIPVDNLVRLQNGLLSEKIRLLEHSEKQLIQQKQQLETLAADLEKANAELESARDLALEGARLKSEFLANMSHEIRTPMNGIVGMISLLQESELDDEQRAFAETVQRSADALLGIINDILDYSKIEAGKLDVNNDDTPVRELIEECVQLQAKAASTKGLELILDIDPDIPAWIQIDPLRYRQILNNLISNGIKFTHQGEVVVVVERFHDREKGLFLRTLVRDSGIGIGEDQQRHLFNAFMQADGSTSRKYGGTGLGLAISRRLATLMNGSLEFSSTPREGSAFWIDLPLIRSEGEEFRDERGRLAPGMRVLLIDDHEHLRAVVGRLLKNLGCEVTSLGDMAAGLKRLRESNERGHPYDFAIAEAEHPGMTGVEFCEKVRKDRSLNELRLILMSDVGFRQRPCCEDVYRIYKPLCPSQLAHTMEKIQPDAPAGTRVTGQGNPPVRPSAEAAPMRILVVEDSVTNQQVAVGMLEHLGHQVAVADNGLQALEFLRCESVDLVLMDCQMPEMDGYACTRAIREGYHGITCTDIPIVAMTAYAMKGDQKKCFDAGMNAYLAKPVRISDLTALFERLDLVKA